VSVRLFAALSLPDDARAALAGWARSLPPDAAVRLVPEENLHVTLVFLGACDEADVDPIADAVMGAARPLGSLAVSGVAWLPSPRRPGVLVADLRAPEELEGLHRDLVVALRPWHEPESRPLRPHVTVARVRRGGRPASPEVPSPPAVAFSAEGLVLYRSRVGGAGASYEPLARAAL
jgi:2'-5' RNA ligase